MLKMNLTKTNFTNFREAGGLLLFFKLTSMTASTIGPVHALEIIWIKFKQLQGGWENYFLLFHFYVKFNMITRRIGPVYA